MAVAQPLMTLNNGRNNKYSTRADRETRVCRKWRSPALDSSIEIVKRKRERRVAIAKGVVKFHAWFRYLNVGTKPPSLPNAEKRERTTR